MPKSSGGGGSGGRSGGGGGGLQSELDSAIAQQNENIKKVASIKDEMDKIADGIENIDGILSNLKRGDPLEKQLISARQHGFDKLIEHDKARSKMMPIMSQQGLTISDLKEKLGIYKPNYGETVVVSHRYENALKRAKESTPEAQARRAWHWRDDHPY